SDAPPAVSEVPPSDQLDRVVDLATQVLREEQQGSEAIDRLRHDFRPLLATLTDPTVRDTAQAVRAHLILILLARLLREMIETITQPTAPLPLPGGLPWRRVNHDGVHAHRSHRVKSPVVAKVRRGQPVIFLEKRKNQAHAWWLDPQGSFRIGWLKTCYLNVC
ncbi:MAG: hypothetical protein WD079_04805, partial [Phycisphaeraceae bacterium]